MEKLEIIEKSVGVNPKNLVIWLHGLGADATDFFVLTTLLQLPPTLFVFPNAPMCSVTINQGMSMRAWYDIYKEDIFAGTVKEDLEKSVLQIENLIAEYVAKGFSPQNIILGGFSQGGVVSLEVAYRNQQKISKVVGFSCYFNTKTNRQPPLVKPSVFLAHGELDAVIPVEYGKQARDFFLLKGFAVDWKQYPIEHTVHNEQISELNRFLLKHFLLKE